MKCFWPSFMITQKYNADVAQQSPYSVIHYAHNSKQAV
jgi:hypothetical protein